MKHIAEEHSARKNITRKKYYILQLHVEYK